jgi:pyrimidine-nucleoside phosphorylase
MRTVDLIHRKRDGEELDAQEISHLIDAYTKEEIPDYQMSAFLMAVFFAGMTDREVSTLTECMIRSGETVDLSAIQGVKVDKHSTGGVGDKTSLVVAPLAAAAGVIVPMISGRALGHTGGTLDKLESIPGFRTDLTVEQFHAQLSEIGLCFIGQSDRIAPADGKLYALRDVTATVDNVSLIAASIMSKKIAAGADAIVLDVKVGDGAFMKTIDDARELAQMMLELGKHAGREVVCVLTDMDQPLGQAVGNALEIRETIATLRGEGPADFTELVLEASAHLLALSDLGIDGREGRARAVAAVEDGTALATYERWIAAQGGDPAEAALPRAPVVTEVRASADGFVRSIGAVDIGMAALRLGAGRQTKDDTIDHAVGIRCLKKRGDAVAVGDVLAEVHARDEASAKRAETEVLAAYELGVEAPPSRAIVLETID